MNIIYRLVPLLILFASVQASCSADHRIRGIVSNHGGTGQPADDRTNILNHIVTVHLLNNSEPYRLSGDHHVHLEDSISRDTDNSSPVIQPECSQTRHSATIGGGNYIVRCEAITYNARTNQIILLNSVQNGSWHLSEQPDCDYPWESEANAVAAGLQKKYVKANDSFEKIELLRDSIYKLLPDVSGGVIVDIYIAGSMPHAISIDIGQPNSRIVKYTGGHAGFPVWGTVSHSMVPSWLTSDTLWKTNCSLFTWIVITMDSDIDTSLDLRNCQVISCIIDNAY